MLRNSFLTSMFGFIKYFQFTQAFYWCILFLQVPLENAAPVYMLLLYVLWNLNFSLFCIVISCIFEQDVELNVSKFCKKCVH